MKKTRKIKMTDYEKFDDFEKEYFKENPKQIEAVKREIIKEYNETPDMPFEDVLLALKGLI